MISQGKNMFLFYVAMKEKTKVPYKFRSFQLNNLHLYIQINNLGGICIKK